MGEDLHELRAVVGPLPDKLAQLEQRDPSSLSFAQAATTGRDGRERR